ncbi:MAG: hypothetical protein JSW20_09730, partial [Nitrospiraceae bacterium]
LRYSQFKPITAKLQRKEKPLKLKNISLISKAYEACEIRLLLDLKSLALFECAGSSPASGTILSREEGKRKELMNFLT